MINMLVMEEYRLLLFREICQKCQFYDTLKFLLIQDHMGLEISKCYYSYSFHLMSAELMRTLATMVQYRLLLFLAIGHVLKILRHFKILTLGSMGTPKMWNV